VCKYDKDKKRAWHKHNREKKNTLSRKWKQENRDKTRESWARYRAKPEAKEVRELYYHTNKELFKALKARNRALRKGAPGTHTPADLRTLLAAQSHRCAYCGADLRKVKRHLDHIIALARGGSNDKANLQYLCAPCNLSKAAKDPIQFAREQGRLL
jgi:5-methylcytosine-specific restriction endonuclease McrA